MAVSKKMSLAVDFFYFCFQIVVARAVTSGTGPLTGVKGRGPPGPHLHTTRAPPGPPGTPGPGTEVRLLHPDDGPGPVIC